MTSVITRTGKGSALTIAEMDGNLTALNNGKAEATHQHGVADLTATGTKSATTFLRGDNTWAAPAGGGSLTAASVRTATGARVYNVKAEFGGFLDGATHPLSNTYASLALARAAFPLTHAAYTISALTDETDWCAIQEAVLTAAATGGGVVALYAGQIARTNRTVDMSVANCVRIEGFPVAAWRTESCGTNAAVLVREAYEAYPVVAVRSIVFYALNIGRGGAGPTTPGTSVAGAAAGAGGTTWRTGATAITYQHAYNVVVENCGFHQYDLPVQYGSDTWLIQHRDCVFTGGNKGIVFEPSSSPSNSGENITYWNCTASNNNYGIYFKPDPFGAPAAISMWVVGGSIDYNNVEQVTYWDASAAGYYTLSSLKLFGVYIETSEAVSGTGKRGYIEGNFSMDSCSIFHNGGAEPLGQFEVAGSFAWCSATNNKVLSPGRLPLFYNASNVEINASGTGNYYTDNAPFKLYWSNNGNYYQPSVIPKTYDESYLFTSGTYNGLVPLDAVSTQECGFFNAAPMNVGITKDADGFSPLVNTAIKIHTGSLPITFVAVSGQTIDVAPGTSRTLPPQSTASLVRQGPNIWSLQGQMLPSGVVTLTDAATITWATATAPAPIATVTLAGNRTLAITGAFNGQRGTLMVKQDATGGRTLALPATSLKSGAPTTTANAVNRYDYVYDGTTYYWEIVPALT